MDIKNVIICGLGSLGLTYANELKDYCNLKILVDKKRKENFLKNKPIFNNKEMDLEYILPNDCFDADLIIISTKSSGLNDAIDYIKNFVDENTIIISLVNGISSEEQIAKTYGKNKILHSYYIGQSAKSKKIDGKVIAECEECGKLFFGTPYDENKEKELALKEFFQEINLKYENPKDILYSQWLKFGVNMCLNQLSAIYGLEVGKLKETNEYKELSVKLIEELTKIAHAYGIKNLDNFKDDVLESIELVNENSITSMLQDVLSKRKTEIDIFGGKIMEFGKLYGIPTPYNEIMYNKIKKIEENF